MAFKGGGPRANVASAEDAAFKEKEADINIDLVVTMCCEEGRHRSVAFVEEPARRLATLNDGDDNSEYWQLDIHITHCDIQDHDKSVSSR
jgi:RNase adaptor protein for sRNA GlmZ degradation